MNFSIRCVGLLLLMALGTTVFAESAPVYDADSLPPFDQVDQGADLPAPPAPRAQRQDAPAASQENSGFVPMEEQADTFVAAEPKKQSAVANPVNSSSTSERLRRLEQQMANIQSSEKNIKIESLQSQMQSLRSEVDKLNHQMQQLQKQSKAQNVAASNVSTNNKNIDSSTSVNDDNGGESTSNIADTSTKKAAAEKATADSKASKLLKKKTTSDASLNESEATQSSPNETTQPNVQEEQQIYQTAYNLIKSKKYAEAISSLQGMLKKYPSGQFASNAHYWLGELYGLSGKNDQALSEFQVVVKNYSESPRIAEAQLKIGLIYAAQSKWVDAKVALKKVVTHYPGTTSARLASEQLKQIKQAGH